MKFNKSVGTNSLPPTEMKISISFASNVIVASRGNWTKNAKVASTANGSSLI